MLNVQPALHRRRPFNLKIEHLSLIIDYFLVHKITSMQKIFLVILLLFGFSSAFSQSPDCSKFKEGKFRIADTRVGAVIIAERKGDYQTESSETLKAIVRFRITWQDNCSYTLRLDKVIRNENKLNFPAGMTVNVKIISTADNSYTQEASSSLTNGTYLSEVTRLN